MVERGLYRADGSWIANVPNEVDIVIGERFVHAEVARIGEASSAPSLRVVLKMPGSKPTEAELSVVSDDHKLEALQGAVTMPQDESRGYIENLAFDGLYGARAPFDYDSITYFCHEEGKLEGYPPNIAVRREGETIDVIVGPIVACALDAETNAVSLSDEQVEFVIGKLSARTISA